MMEETLFNKLVCGQAMKFLSSITQNVSEVQILCVLTRSCNFELPATKKRGINSVRHSPNLFCDPWKAYDLLLKLALANNIWLSSNLETSNQNYKGLSTMYARFD